MDKAFQEERQGSGAVRISEDVVTVVAGLAAVEIPGIAGMSGSSISEILGRKNLSKGVKVVLGDQQATVDLYVIMEYGVRIPEVALAVQQNVRRTLESMTGLQILEVNVHVQGVEYPDGKEKKQPDEGVKK